MARLRVRMELNRGGVGVPLHKLAHVVDEAQKFFRMLGEDVHIGMDKGEWLGFDFDNKSLNFTAEYVGRVDDAQIREFHAAFDGVTLLRRATIAQFARIADPIEEDELIGFGLYQNDHETEPSEWRSLSKREALRITEEIRLLLDRVGDSGGASRIPAALDPNAAASLFKDRREHPSGERRIEVLASRVDRLESQVSGHSEALSNLRGATTNTEQNLQKLLVTVDAFCDKAARQIERLPAPEPSGHTAPASRWRVLLLVAAILAMAFLVFRNVIAPRNATEPVQASNTVKKESSQAPPRTTTPPVAAPTAVARQVAPPPVKLPATTAERAAAAEVQRVELKAIEPTWVGITIDGETTYARLLDANQTKIVESPGTIRVRLGNAGGVEITANGKPIGSAGRNGQVRIVEFTGGKSRFVPIESKPKTP